MAQSRIDNFRINAPKPIDAWRYKIDGTPYASVDEAHNLLTYKYIGRDCVILENGIPKEYWYRESISSALDLVPKLEGDRHMTVEELRASIGISTSIIVTTTNYGGGQWQYVGLNDGQYEDNTGTIIVTADSHVWQRIMFSSTIEASWFGAKGDARYVDTTVSSSTYLQVFKDSSFSIPATDDTQALKAAIKYINDNAIRLTYQDGSAIGGHLAHRPELHLGVGYFYVTESKLLTDVGLGGGANAGFSIIGAGEDNTVIVYSNTDDADDDYLFYDNDKFPNMAFRNFRVDCLQGVEKIFYFSSQGNSQNWNQSNISMKGFKRGIDISGSFNADKSEWRKIRAESYIPGCSFFRIIDNPQSVAHAFYQCDIAIGGQGSSMFNINAGSISIYGGSYTTTTKATLYKINTSGSLLASWAVAINSMGSRVEVQGDSKYMDVNISQVLVTNEDCTNFPLSDGKAKIIIRNAGIVKFDKCSLADIKIAAEVDNANTWFYDSKPTIEFNNCLLPSGDFSSHCLTSYTVYSDVDEDAITVDEGFFPNKSGLGRVILKDCKTTSSVTNVFNDGAPHSDQAFHSQTYTKRVAISKASPSEKAGLPPKNGGGVSIPTTATVTIPLNCIVVNVGIVKGASSSPGAPPVQTWKVKDSDNVDLVILTTVSADEEVVAESNRLFRKIRTEEMRTFTLYAATTNADTSSEGYMFVEYI